MCEKMNGFFGAYPWSKPSGCNCGSGGGGGGSEEGVTREEVEEMLTQELANYVSNNDLVDQLVAYLTRETFTTEIGKYPTKEEVARALTGLATTNYVGSEIQKHAATVAGAFLGHVRGIQKTSEYTERAAVDEVGQIWVKPTNCDINPIKRTDNMNTPVGKSPDGTLWCAAGETAEFPYLILKPSGDTTGVTDRQNIIAAFQNGATIIHLVNGVYWINDLIELPKNCWIIGNGGVGNSPTQVRNGIEKYYNTLVAMPAGCEKGAFKISEENSGLKNFLLCGGGVGSQKFPNWLTHNELMAYSAGANIYDTDGCGVTYGGTADTQIAGADVQSISDSLCIIGFAVAGYKYLPASWCSFNNNLTVRRCSAGVMSCTLASDNTITNLHVDNCTDNIHMKGTGNFRISQVKSFADGCLVNDGIRSGVGKSHGLYLDGCGNMMINNFEVQDSAGTPVKLEYCYNCQLVLQTDRGRTSYTPEQQAQYHVTAKNCFSNFITVNCNKHTKAYYCYSDGVNPCGHNTVIATGCLPDGTIATSEPYETDIFVGAV